MPVPKASAAQGPLIPAGAHRLQLVSVEEKEMPKFEKPEETTTRWVWEFTSQTLDPSGAPYTFSHWTGDAYGNPKAKLTDLLNQMVPGITKAEATNLNTDDLLLREYDARIVHVANQKTGEPQAELKFIEPAKGDAVRAPAPAPAPAATSAPTSAPALTSAPAGSVKATPAFARRCAPVINDLIKRGFTAEQAKALLRDQVTPNDEPSLVAFEKDVQAGVWLPSDAEDGFSDPFGDAFAATETAAAA